MNKARITYRFDPKQSVGHDHLKPAGTREANKIISLTHEEFEVREDQPEEARGPQRSFSSTPQQKQADALFEPHTLNQFTTDFGNWNSAFDPETERVEKIIRESRDEYDPNTGYYRPQDDFESKVPTPDGGPYWRSTQKGFDSGVKYVKPTGPPWLKITASVAGAVITGVAFGFFVLSLFSGSNQGSSTTLLDTTSAASTATQGKKGLTTAGTADAGKQDQTDRPTAASSISANTAAVTIPAKTYSFLQHGVFSSLPSAESAQAELKKKGIASVTEQGDKVAVYVGFASTKEEALGLSNQLMEQKLDVYVKNVDLPAVTQIIWNGTKPETVGAMITQGHKLIQFVSGLTVVHLAETKPTAIDNSSIQTIKTSHQAWIPLSGVVSDGVGTEAKPSIQKMINSMNSMIQSMDEYRKNPANALLRQAQSAMMQYILAEKELLRVIAIQ